MSSQPLRTKQTTIVTENDVNVLMKSDMVLEEGGDKDNIELQSQISNRLNVHEGQYSNKRKRTWTEMLGIDKCLDMFGLGHRFPIDRANNSRMAAQVDSESPKYPSSTNSSYQVVKGILPQWIAGSSEKTLSDHVKLLRDGALFWRRLAGDDKPAAVWLSLKVDDEETHAEVMWRDPQLVMNKAVNADKIPLEDVRNVRIVTEEDVKFFPAGSIGMKTNGSLNCLVIVSEKRSVVLEAGTPQDRDHWIESLTAAVERYIPVLDENKQRKLKDQHRINEIEIRKSSRDKRRAEYALAGMSHTARIMASGGSKTPKR